MTTPTVSKGSVFTVAANKQLSNALDLQIINPDQELVGFSIPGTIVSTAMTFLTSYDGVNFFPLYNQAGTLLSVTVATGTNVGLSTDFRSQLARWRYLQLNMGSSETGGATINALTK